MKSEQNIIAFKKTSKEEPFEPHLMDYRFFALPMELI